MTLHNYVIVLMKFVFGFARMMSEQSFRDIANISKFFEKYAGIFVILAIFSSSAPLISLGLPSKWEIFATFYMVGLCVCFFAQGMCIVVTIQLIKQEMHKFVSQTGGDIEFKERVRQLHGKLVVVHILTGIFYVGGIATWMAFAVWHYLMRKVAYFFLVLFICYIPVTSYMVRVVWIVRNSKTLLYSKPDFLEDDGEGYVNNFETDVEGCANENSHPSDTEVHLLLTL